MPNYRQAPKLYHNKTKYNSNNYYNLPQDLMDCIFQQLDGKNGSQIKLMVVLLGTLGDGSFRISEKWICERCGINSQQAYSTARKALIERGWIYIEDGNIYILPRIIKEGYPPIPKDATEEEVKRIKHNTILSCVKEIKDLYCPNSQTQSEIVSQMSALEPKTQFEIVPQTQSEIVPRAQSEIEYNIIKINKDEQNNGVNLVIPDGLTKFMTNYQIAGEINQQMADIIIDKQQVAPNIIYIPASGKYFKIK